MNAPGTGPLRHIARVDKEGRGSAKSPDYWIKGLPYLDGIEFYHFMPSSPKLSAALLARRIDYAGLLDLMSLQRGQRTLGMEGADLYQSVIPAVWVNAAKKPFHDPRVRRAARSVLNRPALVMSPKRWPR